MSTQNNTRIQSMYTEIKLVMGWDIGDGDSVAFAKSVTDRVSKLEPLYIHKSRDLQVEKSAVAKASQRETGIVRAKRIGP